MDASDVVVAISLLGHMANLAPQPGKCEGSLSLSRHFNLQGVTFNSPQLYQNLGESADESELYLRIIRVF